MALSEKQKRFVAEYLVDLNATQAAIRAGYSKRTARSQGQRMLTNVDIQDAVQAAMREQQARTGVTQDRVIRELEKIAFADRSAYARVVTVRAADACKRPVQVVELADTEELTDDQRAALAGVEETRNGIKISSYDKLKALELLGRHLGVFDGQAEEDTAGVQIIDDV